MVRWACAEQPRRVLDPALGEGVFVDAIESLIRRHERFAAPRIDVFDIDPRMLATFRDRQRMIEIQCRRQDFITASIRGKYDAIVANPPYVRHHAMDYSGDALQRLDRLCGRRLSRMTNLYGLFLVRIWNLLAPGGRAAVITPAEWLNADFGRALKAHLLEQNAFEAILHFDHAAQVFDGALTTAAITLLRRDRAEDAPMTLISVRDVQSLDENVLGRGKQVRNCDLDPDLKWTPLFERSSRTSPVDGPTLGDIARCTRGIATGANQYFTLCESDRQRHGLDHRDLAYCITKAQHVTADLLTKSHVRRLVDADTRIYLLDPRARLTAAVKRYLAEGERLGIHERYLPSHRPTWYRPEERPPAPIWVSVFARGAFRFVHNRAGVRNLTTFHGIYLRRATLRRVRTLFEYLTSAEAQSALRHHRRIYADGLLKVEPRDLEALPIPAEVLRLCGSD